MSPRPVPNFVSYAQNFEDVILWRALQHVRNGFYIDIGALDPLIDSVSLAFYERGWRGVHVEPVPRNASELRKNRPDEEVLEVLVAATAGRHTLYEVPLTGLSTAEADVAALHSSVGYQVQPIEVTAIRLSDILDRYAEKEIHWLKIDVEGLENQVIDSWAPSQARPWIVVVEATMPLSQAPSHHVWEPKLEKLGYKFVYFDGLNRFYLHRNHFEFLDRFGPGPNIFDDFCLGGKSSAPFVAQFVNKIENDAIHLAQIEARNKQLETKLETKLASLKQLKTKLASLYKSRSWKITGWLRRLNKLRAAVVKQLSPVSGVED